MAEKHPQKNPKPAEAAASKPRAVAYSISASETLGKVNCPEGANASKADMIELFEAEGDLKRTFPELYKQLNDVFMGSKAGALMDQGIRYVMVSTSGNDAMGGQVSVVPLHGNTGRVIGIMNEARENLKKAGLTVTQDANQPCTNFGGMSRGLRIEVPPRR